ncbi:MAG: transcriptional regulator [Parvimonas sp.]|nr:transcriptional regulator [Parvimonas sp.]
MESKFMTAEDVASTLSISKSMAYKIIQQLNGELNKQGKITIHGKISRRYFEEKVYM